MKKILLFFLPLMMLFIIRGLAQTVVTGTVKDSNGETLPGVSVMIKGMAIGTTTDVNGRYSVNAPENASTLVFSFIGMQSQEIVVSDRKQIDVTLSEDAASLKEVVVIGYGSQSRSTITTSIAKLDAKVLEHSAMSNPGAALKGTISGLRVVNTTGQPGSVPSILLRGGASINTPGSPLVVVDGVVRTLSDVNPSDIESLQVLKDAASTAIYGARANNGVILITTKRGKAGVSNVTYTLKSGLNKQRMAYEYLNARDFLYYNRMGINNTNLSRAPGGVAFVNPEVQAGYGVNASPNMYDIAKITSANRANFASLTSNGWQWMIDPISQKDTLIFKDYSGQISDAAFNETPYTQDHNLSFTGGNDKSTFAVSVNSYNEDGLVIGTKYQRFSGSLNGAYKIKNNLEVLAGTTYSESKAPEFLPGDIFFRTQAMQPTFKPYDDLGNPSSGSNMSYGNPAYYLDKITRKNSTRRSISSIGVNWELVPDLFLRAKANIYYTDFFAENFDKKIVYQTGNVDVSRPSSASYSKSVQQQHNLTADYNKSINLHNFGFLVGAEYFDRSTTSLSAAGRAAPTDDIYTLNAAVERTSVNSGFAQNRMMSGFSRLTYDYNRKYLFTAVIRYDGVSSLTDHRWGAFPGVSAGWNVHEENFFKSSSLNRFISLLKPRVSYGVSGNIAGIGDYEVQGAYGIQTFYNAQASYLNTGLINNGLRWEKSKSFDGGIELGLIDNKVLLNLAYFRRTTSDLLTNLTLPGYTGFSSVRTNLGNLLNSGYEADINFNVLRTANGITWDIGANASYVKNRILKLPFNGNDKNRQGGTEVYDPASGKVIWVGGYQEGQAFGDIYAYKQERVLKDWDDVNKTVANRYDAIAQLYGPTAYAALTNKTGRFPIEPGDVLWADLDNNNIIDSRDRVKMGNIFPNWTGGFSSNLSYKNFSLYGRFDFAAGHIIYNDLAARTMGQMVGTMNVIDWVKDSWTPTNTDAKYSKFYYGDFPKLNIKRSGLHLATPDDHNSIYYEKGDYLALRELTFSYRLPKQLISKLKMSSVQTYVTGQNLAYFSKYYTGTTPEQGGSDIGQYPLPRTLVFGLQVGF